MTDEQIKKMSPEEFKAFRVKLIKESWERVSKNRQFQKLKVEMLDNQSWQDRETYEVLEELKGF